MDTGNSSHDISRVPRSKKEAQTMYDKMSRYYDFFAEISENGLKTGLSICFTLTKENRFWKSGLERDIL